MEGSEFETDTRFKAWDSALSVEVQQYERLSEYLDGNAPFDTHQGVKGLQFPRVMVVLDDHSSKGFLFSYEKLFGAKPISETDQKNVASGVETSVDRTLRLFYVTCSRAEESLVVVLYTSDVAKARQSAIERGWFREEEVVVLTDAW